MAESYIGKSPQYGYFNKQILSAPINASVTLDRAAADTRQLIVVVGGVIQEPETSYSISAAGTTLTFTETPDTSSTGWIIWLGQLTTSPRVMPGSITAQAALGTSPAADDMFLMYDDNASALKKVAYSDLESDTAAMAANTVKVRDASTTGVPSNKAVADTQILIGDGTGFTAAALSGDVTMTNAGVVTIANTSVENAMMAVNSVDSDQYVDGSIDNAHLADDAVGADELAANAVVNASIASGAAIDATKIADGSVTSAEFQYISTLSSNAQTQINAKAASSGNAVLATAQTFTAGQRGEITALTSATTITIDMADSNNFSVTLAHNATFANPSNDTAGQSGSIFITQDGTGSRTASWGTDWEFAGGTAPTLTTTAAAVDRIDYIIKSGTSIQAVATLAYA